MQMFKIIKWLVVSLITVSSIFLVSCNGYNGLKKELTDDIGVMKIKDDLSVKVEQVDVYDLNRTDTKYDELAVKFVIKNNAKKEKKGIVGADFIIDYGNEEYYYVSGNIDNMNIILDQNEQKSGWGYYKIPKDARKFELLYRPINQPNVSLEWCINLQKNKISIH